MSDDLAALTPEEINQRIEELKERMRPLEKEVAALRGDRDLLYTELRRRERQAGMLARRDLKASMKEGTFPTLAELIEATDEGSFDDFDFNLKTGGEVKLGFPGARRQTVAFTDGRQLGQASDFAETKRLYAAGWSLGAPGKPGLRVHFPGTRLERLVDPSEVFVRPSVGESSEPFRDATR